MKRIAIALSVLTVLVLAGPGWAELCEKCKGKMYIANVGQCVECGGFTGSGAHKLCRKCSARLGQCEHCRGPLNKAGKPTTQPTATPKKLRALELNDSHSGKTVSAIVGQKIIIRLKSNPTTGYSWLVGKVEGDALRQVGKVKYEQRKHAPGRVGVGGKEVFTFRTTKVGTAKLMLEYKGPGKKIARTFTLTLNVKPAPAKHSASYLRSLELDDSHNGKTVSAVVGQQIIIRLKGAPVPGRMWGPAKLAGNAIEQVGQMKFVPDARPKPVFVPGPRHHQPGPVPGARPQPMPGRGLVVHTVGGPGKYVFTFRAVKSGKAEVTTIKGRFPRARRPVRTFALTVNVKADPTAQRVKKLKANLDKFAMTISYQGRGPVRGAPRWCRNITLSVPQALVPRTPSWQVRQISTKQAGKIIDQLAKAGFLARAVPRAPVLKKNQYYVLAVRLRKPGPRSPMLMDIMENIGWGPQLLKRLEGLGLKEVLDGDAAKAVDFLLKPLERFREKKEGPAALELDASHNGKTVSAVVGQEIVIRLKGNATTGYSWVVGKNNGDVLGQVGKVKYVSDQPPMPAGGRGRGLVIHRVGGGGKYVFTFTAKKAGKAKLILEYKRGWEKNKPPAKTFTLTVNVKADRTAERVKKLKANLDKKDFELVLRYHGLKGKPAYMSLGLVWSRQTVRALGKGGGGKRPAPANIRAVAVAGKPNPNVTRMGHSTYVRITKKKDIIKIIDHLADEGFLGKALDITNVLIDPPGGPIYSMQVNAGKMRLHEYLGWNLKMLNRLDGLRKVLDGDAAKEMDKLLKRLEDQRKAWEKKTPVKKL